jgi:hypothetical protein
LELRSVLQDAAIPGTTQATRGKVGRRVFGWLEPAFVSRESKMSRYAFTVAAGL